MCRAVKKPLFFTADYNLQNKHEQRAYQILRLKFNLEIDISIDVCKSQLSIWNT